MRVYVLEKYKPPFLHSIFLFSKVGVLVVNFDDFFIVAYSNHIMWVGPLEGFCCSFLYLKGCQLCLIFLQRESWSQPYRVFLITPQLDHAPQVFNRVYFGGEDIWRKVWHRVVFMQNFWNLKAISNAKIILTFVQSKLVLKNSSNSYGQVSWSDIWFVKKGLNFNLRVIKNRIGSKHLFYLHE
jgi:hypothetical protein